MKRFLIFLSVILAVTGLGFGTYFLVKDNETFTVEVSALYLTEGDSFKIDYEWVDKKIGSTFSVEIEDDSILKHLPEKAEEGQEYFTAQAGGHTVIVFKPSNSRIENSVVNVYVGDGSILSPYYISTPEQLQSIHATGMDAHHLFTLDKFYRQINDIDMSGENFVPIGAGIEKGFVGEYDGGGYEISNLTINHENFNNISNNAGMFNSIGENGRVVNLKLQNVVIKSEESLEFVGTVAAENYGEVERVEVISSTISVTEARAIGGAVGLLKSGESGGGEDYTRHTGEIDRVGVNQLTIGGVYTYTEEGDRLLNITGSSGAIGGLVGEATGGVIVYSYAKGQTYLNNNRPVIYGGLVGYSENANYISHDKYLHQKEGIRIRDSYSSITLNISKYLSEYIAEKNLTEEDFEDLNELVLEDTYIGGVIGKLYDNYLAPNSELTMGVYKIFGTYYDKDNFVNSGELLFDVGEGSLNEVVSKDLIDLSTGVGGYFIGADDYSNEISKEALDPNLGDINEKEEVYFPHNYPTFIEGLETSEFYDKGNFASHYEYDRVVIDGKVELEEELIYWNFESPWNLSASVNDGYPHLRYENVLISNRVEVVNKREIHNLQDLQKMKLDGHYVIVNDIVMPPNPNVGLEKGEEGYDNNWSPWLPIGSKANPFTGSLQAAYEIKDGVKRLFTISGITIDPTLIEGDIEREYGGIFGVTSNENGGYIKNLVLENFNVSGYLVAGALVGSNGFEGVSVSGGRPPIHEGLDITNVRVVGSNIEAFEVVGGIAGRNYGTIKGSSVAQLTTINEENIETSTRSRVALAQDSKMNSIGGLVGHNDGKLERAFVFGGTEITTPESASAVRVGGLAGRNSGEIKESGVYDRVSIRGSTRTFKEVGGEQIADTMPTVGYFGGLAGEVTEDGTIVNSFVSEISINTDTKENTVYVGGISGKVTGRESLIQTVSVNGVALTGYAVGGAVGELDITKKLNYNFTTEGNIQLSDTNTLAMSIVEVKGGSVLTGSRVGGLISIMRNGIVSKSFVRETELNGVDTNSVLAGLVVDLPRVVLPSEKAGVIQEVYVATTFGKVGKSFAMSSSEFLQTPIIKAIPFTNVVFEKPHGFIVNYLFDNDVNGKASNPKTSNWFQLQFSKLTHGLNNLISWIPKYGQLSAKSTIEMLDFYSYDEFNFSDTVWNFSSNNSAYPDLIELVGLQDSLIKNTVKVTVPNNDIFSMVTTVMDLQPIKTELVSGNVVYIYDLENGESFHFDFEFSPDINVNDYKITVKINKDELKPSLSGTYNTNPIFENVEIVVTLTKL